MISIQNEDTLHTPQILPHLETAEVTNASESTAPSNYFAGIGKEDETPSVKPTTPPKITQSTVRKRPRLKTNGLDKLLPSKDPTPTYPAIPVAFPDAIQIKPKWTVVLQYPAYEKDVSVKEKLKTILVKNQSSSQQTISLVPPTTVPSDTSSETGPPVILVKQTITQSSVPLQHGELGSPLGKPKTPTILERNNEAAKRYRNRKSVYLNNLKLRNDELEQENKRLRRHNEELMLKLKEMAEAGHSLQNGVN